VEHSELNQLHESMAALCRLVDTLRGENGCPWDKKQTPETVSIYLIEEAFELADAIETGNADQIREELGDVLFHIVFIARMFREREEFDLARVAQTITAKMIRRHPHVFGDQKIDNSDEVIQNWHKIKLDENKSSPQQSLLDSVPAKLPALMRAYRISDRVAKGGCDWGDMTADLQGVDAGLDELKAAIKNQDNHLIARKYGDLLLTLVNVARRAKVHPESALAAAVKKLELQFKKVEARVVESQREFEEISPEEKKEIWQQVQQLVP
jgi:tetrapyrrole methylase family protein/MazG family protein